MFFQFVTKQMTLRFKCLNVRTDPVAGYACGNSALFVRRDEVEASWEWIDGIINGWRTTGHQSKPYSAGSWGPTAAIALTERHGHSWHE